MIDISQMTDYEILCQMILGARIDANKALDKEMQDNCTRCADALENAASALKQTRWIPVTEQMPDHDQEVWLITQEYNEYLKKYVQHTVKGVHIDANKIDASDWDDYDDTTYDEEKDIYYVNPGWFEISMYWDDYRYSFIHDKVTHWMPLMKKPEIVV